jgi:hypothetical protein
MYIHIGDDTLVPLRDIVAVLDAQTVKSSEIVQELLNSKKSSAVHIGNGPVKSLVITPTQMYLSPMAIASIKKKVLNDTINMNSFGSF